MRFLSTNPTYKSPRRGVRNFSDVLALRGQCLPKRVKWLSGEDSVTTMDKVPTKLALVGAVERLTIN